MPHASDHMHAEGQSVASAEPAAERAPFVQPHHLVILGHPNPASFVASIAYTYCEKVRELGQNVTLRDLYSLGFDPRRSANEGIPGEPPVNAELEEEVRLLHEADVVVFVYPIWFGMPPAIIKGYVDRVMGAGFDAEGLDTAHLQSVLAGKRLLSFTSSASTRPWLEERGQWRAMRRAFEIYLENVFGLQDAGHVHFDAVIAGMKPRFVGEHLAAVRSHAEVLAAKLLGERRAHQAKHMVEDFARAGKELH